MQIQQNVNLKEYNTFGFNAIASFFVEVNSENDLLEISNSNILKNRPFVLVGSGSNLLFTSDFEGLVIHINIQGIDVVSENESEILLAVNAGENWEKFVDKMVASNYGGVENLALIPGLCGSSAVQNIGAYGVEVANVITKVRYFDLQTNTFETIDGCDCKYGYRDSIFKHELKNRAIITQVFIRLSKKHTLNISYSALKNEIEKRAIMNPTIHDIATIVKEIRSSKLPDTNILGSAGSFFKNPYLEITKLQSLKELYPTLISYPVSDNMVKLAAGQLIELCGWKGKIVNHVGVHRDQALILVHYGGGVGSEIVQLAKNITDDVLKKFGVLLSPEVIFI